jgi:small subunit ribosomal protein S17
MSEVIRGKKKVLKGVVVGDKMDKTVRVEMTRRFRHPVYKKFVTSKKTFLAHDEGNQCGVGDKVLIVESKPLSRLKRWRVKSIIEKAV